MEKDIEAKIKALELENQYLRKRLSQYEPIELHNIQLSIEEKLDVFMKYFKGREDVVAIRFFHKTKIRYAYTPFVQISSGRVSVLRKLGSLIVPNALIEILYLIATFNKNVVIL